MVLKVLREFLKGSRSDCGAVAIIFALLALLLFALAGIGLDTSRAVHAATRTTQALDAAALAAAKGMNTSDLTDAEVQAIAQDTFNANTQLNRDQAVFTPVNTVIDRDAGSVTVSVTARVPSTFTKVLNLDYLDVNRSVTAIYKMKNVELAMMLDVSGSMGGQKIADLRSAANDVVNILIPDESSDKVKIGIAPYATSVNAGPYANAVTGGQSSSCVSERSGGSAFTDDSPAVQLIGADATSCPSAFIQPLTNDKNVLTGQISALSPGGWTAGHLGVGWSYYIISPDWSAVWPGPSQPVAYDDEETIKAVILMTDGRFNTEYVSANGDSASQAIEICDHMKGNNVEVYSVAFQAPSSDQATLQACASGAKYYYDAQNGDQLKAAFQAIAMRLAKLRLSK